MSSSAPALPSGLSLIPADLDRTQRGVLVGTVVLAHVAIAWGLMVAAGKEQVVDEPTPAIEVALITQEAPPSPPPPPAPPPPIPAPPVPKVTQAPKMVASPAPAQPTEMVVPAPPPEPPAPAPAPAMSQQPPAPPAPPAAAPVPAQPKELPSASLRYLVQPPVTYPRVSKELGESGVVTLRILIDEQGRLKNVEVVKSSGYPRLDQQAVASMRQARFQPLIDNGVPRAVVSIAPIVFSMEE